MIDFGAVVDGYCSDMTRTVCVGEPASATRPAHGRRGGREPARRAWPRWPPASPAQAVDEACRAVIAEAGWADAFVHGTGHGVGLEIHEAPRVSSASTDTLAAGHVVTVEPGVYLPERAACASRTRWSSPTTGASRSPTRPRTS